MRVLSRHGTRVSLAFAQHAFGLAFLAANEGKVVNASYELLTRAAEYKKHTKG